MVEINDRLSVVVADDEILKPVAVQIGHRDSAAILDAVRAGGAADVFETAAAQVGE